MNIKKGTIKRWGREAFQYGMECECEPFTANRYYKLEERIDKYFKKELKK